MAKWLFPPIRKIVISTRGWGNQGAAKSRLDLLPRQNCVVEITQTYTCCYCHAMAWRGGALIDSIEQVEQLICPRQTGRFVEILNRSVILEQLGHFGPHMEYGRPFPSLVVAVSAATFSRRRFHPSTSCRRSCCHLSHVRPPA